MAIVAGENFFFSLKKKKFSPAPPFKKKTVSGGAIFGAFAAFRWSESHKGVWAARGGGLGDVGFVLGKETFWAMCWIWRIAFFWREGEFCGVLRGVLEWIRWFFGNQSTIIL